MQLRRCRTQTVSCLGTRLPTVRGPCYFSDTFDPDPVWSCHSRLSPALESCCRADPQPFSWTVAGCHVAWREGPSLFGDRGRLLTFRDPSIQPPDVESIIKINSGQTAASFPGLPELSLLGKDREHRSGVGSQTQGVTRKSAAPGPVGDHSAAGVWAADAPETSAQRCWALRHTLGKPACWAPAQGRVRRTESGGPWW